MASSDTIELRRCAHRATVAGDGQPGPIEERIGRRLVRVVNPFSDEGARLLGSGEVEIVGPWGESFGRIEVREAWVRLAARLETCLAAAGADESLREGLRRLRAMSAGGSSN
jgi:hypothetical protein